MKLTIKNIGTIKEAEIELSGLTVIAGENDSGKSTVGKLMFSIVKAIS
ncbi:MAG: ABC transporter ATP-binding protein, partial [Gammaproteobacteria bacterium]|nr:ABC transporter ATP-binding protein [Gammaproteobacteria bacterium]